MKTSPVDIERRSITRHRANTRVRIRKANGTTCMCTAENLSAFGVAIRTNTLNLKPDEDVELNFMINLGTLIKIHRRKATHKHTTYGVSGFAMTAYPTQEPNTT